MGYKRGRAIKSKIINYDERYETINNWKIDKFQPLEQKPKYMCECLLCNRLYAVNIYDIKSEKSKQCKGCATAKRNLKHEQCGTRLYGIWSNMKDRVLNNKGSYSNVTICDEWLEFEPFYRWSMSNGYKNILTIDKDILCDQLKISPKIYSPETCMWITKNENSSYAHKGIAKNKEAIFKSVVARRTITDEEIEKTRLLIEIIEYKDIIKIMPNINDEPTVNRIKNGLKTISELRNELNKEIVSSA